VNTKRKAAWRSRPVSEKAELSAVRVDLEQEVALPQEIGYLKRSFESMRIR
jgi:hypothetical protein